jgi:uracil phosphoribosyltransferase
MVHHLSVSNSILNKCLFEMRSIDIQKDRWRFRKNMERCGMMMAYELSKTLHYEEKTVETPLGEATINMPSSKIVIASILRAGLPLHNGFLEIFDDAENAFVSAYRQHHKDGSFEINTAYVTCPILDGKVLIIVDPMLASGSSMHKTIDKLMEFGTPEKIHIVSAIASTQGVNHINRYFPKAHIWAAAIDDELTAKSYIVPGLGDAGDLAFGEKLQD